MLGHTLCKLEKQRSQWRYSVGVRRSKHQELCCPRAGRDGHASSRRERDNSLFLHLFIQSRPSMDCINTHHIGGALFIAQTTDLNANIF